MTQTQLYIDGKWTGAKSGDKVEVINPATEESIEAVDFGGREEAANALEAASRAFKTAVKKHIKDISGRYIIPAETADSALMFLPSEAVYAELYANFPDVVDEAFGSKIWIVSPTTLMATLHTVRAGGASGTNPR